MNETTNNDDRSGGEEASDTQSRFKPDDESNELQDLRMPLDVRVDLDDADGTYQSDAEGTTGENMDEEVTSCAFVIINVR
jgi:hypothetical protein